MENAETKRIGKTDLIAKISETTGYTKKDIAMIFEATINTIGEYLQNGDRVTIPGFGTFKITEIKARSGINPRTKEPIEILAANKVVFSAGHPLRVLVNTKPNKPVNLTKKK